MEIKFTKTGKKVGIIEYVNETDIIVQEVFSNDNDGEFLGGQKFVVHELFDHFPIISYEQRELERIKASYRTERKRLEKEVNDNLKEIRELKSVLSARIKWLRNVAKQPFEDEVKKLISRVCDFYECKDMWAGYMEYRGPVVFPFKFEEVNRALDRFEYTCDIPKFDGMRLISIYGVTEGNFDYRIDNYGTGTNCSIDRDKKYFFFSSQQEAIQFVQDWADKKEKYDSYVFEAAKEYGIKLNKDKVREYYNTNKASKYKEYEEKKKQILDIENKLKFIEENCENSINNFC